MKRVLAVMLCCAVIAGVAAAQTGADAPKKKTKKSTRASSTSAAELSEIKSMLQSQQQQIQQLQQQVQSREQQIQQLQQRLDQSQSAAAQAQSQAQSAMESTSKLQSDITDLKGNATSAALSLQETQKQVKEASEHPTAIHFKGITITPGGFIEAATVNRSRAESADINSDLKGFPYANSAAGKLTEMQFSARQSRLTLLAEGKAGEVKYSGYFEGDFLGTGVTSNNRQSNSYVFRQRQLFARVDLPSHWAFTAGQQWSLATENTKGIVNRSERFPLQIDPQYVVGFTWQRAWALRVVKSWDKLALGLSAEGSQTTLGGRGFSQVTNCIVVSGTSCSGSSVASVTGTNTNFFVNLPGNGAGLYNFVDTSGYTPNHIPDLIAKAAIDPGGNWGHYEVFGILSSFRNRVYPCGVVGTDGVTTVACPVDSSVKPSALGAFNDSRLAGGIGGSGFWTFFDKKVDLGAKVVAGDGIGRFGTAQLADATLRPDGTLAPIRTLHYLTSFVVHPNKKWDVYTYWGSEYAARAAYAGYTSITNATITNLAPPPATITTTTIKNTGIGGYGNPHANNTGCQAESAPSLPGTGPIGTIGNGLASGGGTCAGDPRVVSEATLGFWHRIYQGDKGKFQWGLQYSYLYKIGWGGDNNVAGATVSPRSHENMIWSSFRYYLP